MVTADEGFSYDGILSILKTGLEDVESRTSLADSPRDSMGWVRTTRAAIPQGAARVFKQKRRHNSSLAPPGHRSEALTEIQNEKPNNEQDLACHEQIAAQLYGALSLEDETDDVICNCPPGFKLLPNISVENFHRSYPRQIGLREKITEEWDAVTPISPDQKQLLGRIDEEPMHGAVPTGLQKERGECVRLSDVSQGRLPGKKCEGGIPMKKEQEKILREEEERIVHTPDETIESFPALLRAHERKLHCCEVLYARGHIIDAAESLIQIAATASEAVRADKLISDWLTELTHRCVSSLELTGDEASGAKKHDEAILAYSTALSMSHLTPNSVLLKWANLILVRDSTNDALGVAAKFKLPKSDIFRTICDVLEGDDRVEEAVACFWQMENELAGDTSFHAERAQWKVDFQYRCIERLGRLSDIPTGSQDYNGAAEHFSAILSLNPVDRIDVLIKRSEAQASMKLWKEALSDADEVIELDPSCHRGYERRYAALHGMKLYVEAIEAFDSMLGKIEESPNAGIRQLHSRFVDARPTIRRIVSQIIRPMPRVLIDTTTGRLCNKKQQAEAFEALPIYSELVSSMTTQLDQARILAAVKESYQYVMLSHKWEHDEPLLQKVEGISIYDLESSSANIKLQKFCSLVRSLGFKWAWSDTCCVDKSNNVVLQESLIAMFTWYHGSSLTVVYLHDVSSESQFPGDLQESIWNTRAWTYQEYVAAKIARFFTEDWKPYLGLTLPNHKESPEIISEMQQAMGASVQKMAVLHPGLDRVREKLYLASKRETTLVEDIAYSLFGIFNVAIPVIYGEGNRAVGRLLEHVLNGSGDVTVLAWTGSAGGYNSCLPADLTVYDLLVPPHIPLPIETAEKDGIIVELRSSFPDLSPVMRLYNRLNELPSPSLGASRLKLPGIVIPLTESPYVVKSDSGIKLRVYRGKTLACGDVEIKTADDLTGMKGLCLVHPWIRPLLDQEFSHGAAALDKITQALRLVARLRQSFGALLFESLSRVEYRRVATDSLIIAQIREEVSLTDLIDGIRTIEVQ